MVKNRKDIQVFEYCLSMTRKENLKNREIPENSEMLDLFKSSQVIEKFEISKPIEDLIGILHEKQDLNFSEFIFFYSRIPYGNEFFFNENLKAVIYFDNASETFKYYMFMLVRYSDFISYKPYFREISLLIFDLNRLLSLSYQDIVSKIERHRTFISEHIMDFLFFKEQPTLDLLFSGNGVSVFPNKIEKIEKSVTYSGNDIFITFYIEYGTSNHKKQIEKIIGMDLRDSPNFVLFTPSINEPESFRDALYLYELGFHESRSFEYEPTQDEIDELSEEDLEYQPLFDEVFVATDYKLRREYMKLEEWILSPKYNFNSGLFFMISEEKIHELLSKVDKDEKKILLNIENDFDIVNSTQLSFLNFLRNSYLYQGLEDLVKSVDLYNSRQRRLLIDNLINYLNELQTMLDS